MFRRAPQRLDDLKALGLRTADDQVRFIVKRTNGEYQCVKGWLVEKDSVHDVVYNAFTQSHQLLLSELSELAEADVVEAQELAKDKIQPELAVRINSASFCISQKVSEYLFLRAQMRGGKYYEQIPQILDYSAVTYFFKPSKERIEKNGFVRYGVEMDEHVLDTWQSHKGRHWQTTSLFRAGLPAMVVNKWMGRTDTQGEHYDHNTGRERAQMIGQALAGDTERFLGNVPNKVREWRENEIPEGKIIEHLNRLYQAIQYSPFGYCTRDLHLKPCEFNLQCLTGSDGAGCKHYIFDLDDPAQREKIEAERDKSSLELGRLFEAYEQGVEAAEMHIQHHMMIVRNTTGILERAQLALDNSDTGPPSNFMPFKVDGSYPEDCPFQCGGDD